MKKLCLFAILIFSKIIFSADFNDLGDCAFSCIPDESLSAIKCQLINGDQLIGSIEIKYHSKSYSANVDWLEVMPEYQGEKISSFLLYEGIKEAQLIWSNLCNAFFHLHNMKITLYDSSFIYCGNGHSHYTRYGFELDFSKVPLRFYIMDAPCFLNNEFNKNRYAESIENIKNLH